MKLTEWFDGDVAPVRPGLYQRCRYKGRYWAWWNGRQWMCGHLSLRDALGERFPSKHQHPKTETQWRGVLR